MMHISITVPSDTKDALDAVCEKSGVPRSTLLTRLLIAYLNGSVKPADLPVPTGNDLKAVARVVKRRRIGSGVDRG